MAIISLLHVSALLGMYQGIASSRTEKCIKIQYCTYQKPLVYVYI